MAALYQPPHYWFTHKCTRCCCDSGLDLVLVAVTSVIVAWLKVGSPPGHPHPPPLRINVPLARKCPLALRTLGSQSWPTFCVGLVSFPELSTTAQHWLCVAFGILAQPTWFPILRLVSILLTSFASALCWPWLRTSFKTHNTPNGIQLKPRISLFALLPRLSRPNAHSSTAAPTP